jgi:hypothetical protein
MERSLRILAGAFTGFVTAGVLALAIAASAQMTFPEMNGKIACHVPSVRSARAARLVVSHFVAWAVLRKDPLRARALVTPALAAGTTRRDWRRGFIPVVPFVARGQVRLTIRVDVQCRHSMVFNVGLHAVDAGGEPELFRLDEVRRGGRWLVDYWGPPGIPAPYG